jgi:hypothetical protein
MADYVAPAFETSAFNCPSCGVYSRQTFYGALRTLATGRFAGGFTELTGFHTSSCDHCEAIAIWHEERLIYPLAAAGPIPHADMPSDVVSDYREARTVADLSPRSGSALLRLALQKLCKHLGEPGKNINDDIGSLVKRGLNANVQRALDVLRITGNNALHPGELDVRDDRELVGKLFALLNVIVQQVITQPREIEELWEKMPRGAREAVDKRDANE